MKNILDTLLTINISEMSNTQDTTQDITEISEQVRKLLSVIDKTPRTTVELMFKVNNIHRQTFRNNYILPTLKLGLISMTIPDKPTSRSQKYYSNNKDF